MAFLQKHDLSFAQVFNTPSTEFQASFQISSFEKEGFVTGFVSLMQ